ncbi:MAG: hypothetical protein KDD81_02755, partial [Rhodobacteraceae bacterium]|nr:hypothetical protein [Paracoccaceae bacterium]
MHRHEQRIACRLQLLIRRPGLRPVRDLVQLIDRPPQIIGFAFGKKHTPIRQPAAYRRQIIGRKVPAAIGPDLPVLDVDGGNLIHLDPALTVFSVD